jgi:hypothetical protein
MNSMRYTVLIEPADDGAFSVYVPDLTDSICLQAQNMPSVFSNFLTRFHGDLELGLVR